MSRSFIPPQPGVPLPVEPTVHTQPDVASPAEPEQNGATESGLSRRGFLRVAGAVGLTGVAASVAACTTAAAPAWSFGAPATPGAATTAPSTAPASQAPASAAPSASAPSASASASASPAANIPPGWTVHDIAARDKVRRYVGNLAPAFKDIYPAPVFLKLATILGVEDNYPELQMKPAFAQVPNLVITDAVSPLKPTMEGDVKVFNLTVDEMEWNIDELLPSVAALGYNAQWPGPTIRATEGDKLRVKFKNNLPETTSVHFHGVEFADFFQDGVPFVTQLPITPGEEYAYDFVAERPGSLMYHSHHNATDQVGRGLLGGFVVEPKKPGPEDNYDREYVWISNDTLGGFTINGHGFPATVPVLAAQGETVRVRFMNEGTMMHPWHLHGYRMNVVARDGYPLEGAAFGCDTLGVNPGERYDVNIKADRLGIWAFHCHILPHVEGTDGMFGMVATLIVVPEKAHVDAIVAALLA
jgi:FtsP/CotA-like multicopper oxidase with cupredoxin domain